MTDDDNTPVIAAEPVDFVRLYRGIARDLDQNPALPGAAAALTVVLDELVAEQRRRQSEHQLVLQQGEAYARALGDRDRASAALDAALAAADEYKRQRDEMHVRLQRIEAAKVEIPDWFGPLLMAAAADDLKAKLDEQPVDIATEREWLANLGRTFAVGSPPLNILTAVRDRFALTLDELELWRRYAQALTSYRYQVEKGGPRGHERR